jgi:hypothetical protein
VAWDGSKEVGSELEVVGSEPKAVQGALRSEPVGSESVRRARGAFRIVAHHRDSVSTAMSPRTAPPRVC